MEAGDFAMSDGKSSNDVIQLDMNARNVVRELLHPSTLLLLAANSLPIVGVLLWHWDVFVLIVLYWMETAVIGFWTILRIALAPPGSMGPLMVNGRPSNSSFAMAAFFLVHSGIFMTVHFVFLWVLFSGWWKTIVHGPVEFVRQVVIGSGLWVPLVILFLVRGTGFVFHVLKPEFIEKLERSLNLPESRRPSSDTEGSLIGGFYARIVIMHLTILASAFLTVIFKWSVAPLIIMVALKTIADVAMHLAFDFGNLRKVSQTVSTVATS
jgi:Family of unknown function (DUF6498)